MFEAWQAIPLWKRVMVGLVLGMAIGFVLRATLGTESKSTKSTPDAANVENEILDNAEETESEEKPETAYTAEKFADGWIKPWGDAFVRLIKMLIIPLIATTLVIGVTAMGDPKKLGVPGYSDTWALFGYNVFRRYVGTVNGNADSTRGGSRLSNCGYFKPNRGHVKAESRQRGRKFQRSDAGNHS